MIGLKISRHFFIQSKEKWKPLVTPSHMFSRVSRQLLAFISSFDWICGLSVPFVIGQSDNIGFGFTTLNLKLLFKCFPTGR